MGGVQNVDPSDLNFTHHFSILKYDFCRKTLKIAFFSSDNCFKIMHYIWNLVKMVEFKSFSFLGQTHASAPNFVKLTQKLRSAGSNCSLKCADQHEK